MHREQETHAHPNTPDGRYFVVRGRLWRRSNPALPEAVREELVRALMDARRAVQRTKRVGSTAMEREARQRVQAAKEGLGERGPVWWTDESPDYNQQLVANTPYHAWYETLSDEP
jgi:hypothetical protein